MNEWKNMSKLDKTQEILLWSLIFIGIIGSFVNLTFISFTIFALAMRINKKIEAIDTKLDNIATDVKTVELEIKKREDV